MAGICYQCIGVFASLLLAAVLLGFGAAKLFHPRLRVTSPNSLDRAVHRIRCMPRPVVGHRPLARLESAVDIQATGGWIGYLFADEHRGLLRAALGPVRLGDPDRWSLCDDSGSSDRIPPDSSCSGDGCGNETFGE